MHNARCPIMYLVSCTKLSGLLAVCSVATWKPSRPASPKAFIASRGHWHCASELVNAYAHRVPHDVDLIVGIPRSGMLVASILSLKLNLPMTDLYAFCRNDALDQSALRHCHGALLDRPWEE